MTWKNMSLTSYKGSSTPAGRRVGPSHPPPGGTRAGKLWPLCVDQEMPRSHCCHAALQLVERAQLKDQRCCRAERASGRRPILVLAHSCCAHGTCRLVCFLDHRNCKQQKSISHLRAPAALLPTGRKRGGMGTWPLRASNRGVLTDGPQILQQPCSRTVSSRAAFQHVESRGHAHSALGIPGNEDRQFWNQNRQIWIPGLLSASSLSLSDFQ